MNNSKNFKDWSPKDWELFIDSGNIYFKDELNRTPFSFFLTKPFKDNFSLEKRIFFTKQLIEKGGDIHFKDEDGNTLLHLFSDSEPSFISFLIQKGIDPNIQNKHGETALHCTLDKSIAKELIQCGTDVNLLNHEGQHAFHEFYLNDEKMVRLFRSAKFNFKVKNIEGNTFLHLVSKKKVCQVLIKTGIDVNSQNKLGNTPLHNATNEEVAKFFIENGANVNSQNKNGQTPLGLTMNLNIMKILIEGGADIHLKNNLGEEPFEAILNNLDYYGLIDEHYQQGIKDLFLKQQSKLDKEKLETTLPKSLSSLKKNEFRL